MTQVLTQTFFCILQINKIVDQKVLYIIAYQGVVKLLR